MACSWKSRGEGEEGHRTEGGGDPQGDGQVAPGRTTRGGRSLLDGGAGRGLATATGGPDLIRGIFPIVAVIDADGFRRLEDDEIRSRFEALLGDLSPANTRGSADGGARPDQEIER